MARQQVHYTGIIGSGEYCGIESVHRLGFHIVNYIGGVLAATTGLYVGFAVVDVLVGRNVVDTVLIRGVGGLVMVGALGLWYWGRIAHSWLLVDLARLIVATTISIGTSLVGHLAGTTAGVAMAGGVMISLMSVLLLRSKWLTVFLYLGAMAPPVAALMLGQPAGSEWAEYMGVVVITGILMAIVLRMETALFDRLVTLQAQLARDASTDSLTGLANRRSWSERIAAWEATNPATAYEILFFDLDRFKDVNDRIGHEAGDRALCVFAGYLSALTPPDGVAGRFGGDEFVVFLPESEQGGDAFVEGLSRCMQEGDLHRLGLEVSVGRATGGLGLSSDEVLWQADQALLSSKRRGQRMTVPTPV